MTGAAPALLRAMIDAVADAVVAADDSGRILTLNRAAEDLFGWGQAEVAGQPVEVLMPRAERASHRAAVTAWQAGGPPRMLGRGPSEQVVSHRDGRRLEVEIDLSATEVGGRRLVIAVARDIGARRRAEEALKAMERCFADFMDHAPAQSWIKDADLRYVFVNRRHADWIGRPAAEIQGRTDFDLLDEGLATALHATDRAALVGGHAVDFEQRIGEGADARDCLFLKFPFSGARGAMIGAMVFDLTDRKRIEHALREARDAAEQASRTKTEFLTNVSHELRTPLNSIIGFSRMLIEQVNGPLDPAYVGYARDILAGGTHLLAVINDILDISKVEAGAYVLDEEAVDLSALSRAVLRMIRPRAERGDVDLVCSCDPDLPAVRGDERVLRQILLNLVANAVKFTPPQGRVEVCVRRDRLGGVTLAVADTGIGMAPEDIAVALTPFGQVDADRDRQFQGTGLGLPLSERFAALHDGRLEIDSTPGLGTTVRVRLPAERLMAIA